MCQSSGSLPRPYFLSLCSIQGSIWTPSYLESQEPARLTQFPFEAGCMMAIGRHSGLIPGTYKYCLTIFDLIWSRSGEVFYHGEIILDYFERMSPKSNGKCPFTRDRQNEIWHTQRRRRWVWPGQRVEQYKRKSGTISSYKKMEETGRDSPPEPLEGAWPCQDLDFGSVKIILHP